METLDKFDVAILVQLQTDARQTNEELAATAVWGTQQLGFAPPGTNKYTFWTFRYTLSQIKKRIVMLITHAIQWELAHLLQSQVDMNVDDLLGVCFDRDLQSHLRTRVF